MRFKLFTLVCVAAILVPQTARAQKSVASSPAQPGAALDWHDIRPLGVEGQGWSDTKAPFDRMPAKAEGKIPDAVWNLSRQSAGLCVRFVTDSPAIHARWTLTSKQLAMPHMPATGVSGLDLYYRGSDEKWRWLGVGVPSGEKNTSVLASGIPPGKREYLLYLPLYNGVSSVEIGVAKGRLLERAPDYPEARYFAKTLLEVGPRPDPSYRRKPIVFYGTSITQGACASRPGMVHTAILQRRLNCPVINLGFSGNGRMEKEVAELIAEIDASIYVLDCLPNMSAKEVEDRADPFVRTLLRAHPKTPIVLVEDRSYANATLLPGPRERNRTSRAALKKVYDRLIADKAGGIHYLAGEQLLGDDTDATVDSSHPSDLGFARQADAIQKVLQPLLPPLQLVGPNAFDGAYTDKLSYVPGEEVAFHMSSGGTECEAEIARHGAERTVVWKKSGIRVNLNPIPADASSHGCRWPVAFKVRIPPDWKSGYYSARLTNDVAKSFTVSTQVFFVVRSAHPGRDTKILLQFSTNTYNAYCNWGGYSLYAYNGRHGVQGRRVSFDRPMTSQFPNWEQAFVYWAEKNGYAIDYAVNSDLEFHPEILKHYKLILSVGHDEYWSAPMRDNLEKFIADGGNVAFFSGNTCCWQVRSEDNGRALVCWKQSFKEDPFYAQKNFKLLSSLWSHHLVQRPENELTGVGFPWGGYHLSHGQLMDGSGAFSVHQPQHWVFAGTNLRRGDAFGGKDTIVGYECDGCELTWKDGVPTPTHRDGTPRTFQVLATAPARWAPDDCEWYEKWEKGRSGNAVMGIYTRGGTVVTVGTTDWSHGLRGNDPNVMRITKNILDRLSK